MVAWPFLLADMRTIDQKSHGLPCLVSRVATNQIYWCLMNECLIFLFQLQPSLFRTSSLLNRRSGVSPSGSSTIWLETGVHSKPSQPPWFHQLVSPQTWVACHWLLRSLGNLIASLRTGIFLTVKQVQSIITAFKIEEPLPGSGSGKGGRVIKVDHCTALVTGLFPLASEQEKAFMITSLMVRKQVRPEDAPEYLLKLTSMLDTNEAQHFSHVRKAAIDELKVAAMRANIAKCKQGKHEDDDEAEEKTRGRKPKRGLEQDEPESSGASGSRSKAPRTGDESKDHEEKLQRLNIRAPPEFLKFFPLVSYCYFKWAPKNFRVTVEFVQKERILTFSYITFNFNCVIFFREQKSYLNQSQNLRYGFGPENPVPTVVWERERSSQNNREQTRCPWGCFWICGDDLQEVLERRTWLWFVLHPSCPVRPQRGIG